MTISMVMRPGISLSTKGVSNGGPSTDSMLYLPHWRDPVFVDRHEVFAVDSCQPYGSSRKPGMVSKLSPRIMLAYPATMASVVCSRQW